MAIDIAIKQKGLFKKKITLDMIKSLLRDQMVLGERDSNSAYVFYELKSEDIDNVNIVVQNPNHYGRGFIIYTKGKELCTSLNVPTTNQDVNDFFDFVQKACTHFKVDSFTMYEERQIKVNDLESQRQETAAWNIDYLSNQVKELHENGLLFIVFGVNNPIYIPASILEQWSKETPENLEAIFSSYLHLKQSEDLYYMKPTFYQKNQDILGAYTLTETVDSIVAKQAFVPPITSGLPDGIEPNIWNLGIVRFPDNAEPTIDYIPYNTFLEKIKDLNLEEYDQKHWILRNPSKNFLERLLE
ncbi:DUF4299 family protein [Myroides marinus]|uniref:DUF4299 domain-containing protein n=1 Tax=Myroides marinus TaxID=703342 RepID=A0A1H6Y1A5_9FLAO|nr:DUF4299 family protein [Myroides marinus]MDM1354690.1 DUF4299 family protein [Myroides marinus]MDM1361825.1 DUF4299 family protein [Myroides marinus]MDM1366168.1 DUF4299 family protein [Myroides marinus]MDM1378618.1 DUF4299 family protein [Myroides marinus]MDM1385889.1 DUF4299 family protein [Myroides marinus]